MRKNYKTNRPDARKDVVGKDGILYVISAAKPSLGADLLAGNLFQWWIHFLPYPDNVTEIAINVLLDIRYNVMWFNRKYLSDDEPQIDATGLDTGLIVSDAASAAALPTIVFDDRADTNPAA